jgi:hypothetical protein
VDDAPIQQKSWEMPYASKRLILIMLLLLGSGLRLYKFPSVPIGLHQDEISAAYESYCLLHTGADRWGYHLPVYFLSWGSGQNVLQSYLSIPVIAVTGLTPTGARFIPVICGLMTLPLFFFTMRRWHGEVAAFTGLLILAVCPWQVMYSRFGVEYSALPFFFLLGIWWFGKALESESTWVIVLSLLPFDLVLYTYGITILILPAMFVLLFFIGFRQILREPAKWAAAFALFAVGSLPICLFTVKNYVTKTNYSWEHWLPFSVPLLPVTRLSEVLTETRGVSPLHFNLVYFLRGMSPNSEWFTVPGLGPLPLVVLWLALLGAALQVWRTFRSRRIDDPFFAWLLACIPLLPMVPLNPSRGEALCIPIMAMAAVGFARLFEAKPQPVYRGVVAGVLLLLLAAPTGRFIHRYFGRVYVDAVRPSFYPELPAAMREVQQRMGPGTGVYISDQITMNYLQTLFYMRIDPKVFQASGATYDHPDFGPYRFSRETAKNMQEPFVFLLTKKDQPVCGNASDTMVEGPFVVGLCP